MASKTAFVERIPISVVTNTWFKPQRLSVLVLQRHSAECPSANACSPIATAAERFVFRGVDVELDTVESAHLEGCGTKVLT
jgi:hypothetical protein